jgi:hypothetical protein
MSALGQKQTYAVRQLMSALPPKPDMCGATADVCFGPKADMGLTQMQQRPRILLIGAPIHDLAADHCKHWLDVFNFVRWDGEIVAI